MKRLLGLAILTIALATPSAAVAGEYVVRACAPGLGNHSWHAEPGSLGVAQSDCLGEGIVTSHHTANTYAPRWSSARHVFYAPPGSRIVRFRGFVKQSAMHGWWSGFMDRPGHFIWGGPDGTTWGNHVQIDFPTYTPHLIAQISCEADGCPRPVRNGLLAMRDVAVTIRDDIRPDVSITGGLKSPSGWLRGNQEVHFNAGDVAGIRSVEALVGGRSRATVNGVCNSAEAQPCTNLSRSISLPTSFFAGDGRHTVVVRARDAAGNVRDATRSVLVDNTAPSEPRDFVLHDGAGWRSRNAFSMRWTNPPQTAAPVAAARYKLCPALDSFQPSSCSQGRVAGRGITSLSGLAVPKSGEWRITVWLEDAAGNADPERSVAMRGLGFDSTAPDLAFSEARASDPARVRVTASDATTRIAAAWIEARRRGEDAWRSIPTALERGGFSAVLDDERLPKGHYDLRARARDLAGNERTIDNEARTLPIRLGTRLSVGRPTRVRARRSRGKGRYRTVLVVRPRAKFGRTIPIRGRLTMPGDNPLEGANIEVWERVKLPKADWRRVGQLRTSPKGRFRFKALPGPSRVMRFRYPGTPTIRARSTHVDLRVRAATSLKVTRTRVVNGEEVTFKGALKGRQFGSVGKLLHLQVYTRGKWSTFATPRANRRTGSWRVPYRFTATRGRVTYRFRALVPREASFPYETGSSRSLRVVVDGL